MRQVMWRSCRLRRLFKFGSNHCSMNCLFARYLAHYKHTNSTINHPPTNKADTTHHVSARQTISQPGIKEKGPRSKPRCKPRHICNNANTIPRRTPQSPSEPKKHKPLDPSKPWLSWTDEQLKAEILVMEKKTADMKRMADQAVKEYNLEKNLQEAFTESMDKYTPDVVAKLDSAAEIVGDLFEGFCFQRSSRAKTSTRRTD
jgi:hypothetical protein